MPLPAPSLTRLRESATTWREGNARAQISTAKRKRKPPIGTTFSFVLNEPATATLNFTQPRGGRRVRRVCVAQSRLRRGKPRCTRTVVVGPLTLAAHAGTNKVRFAGQLSRSRKLSLGRYMLQITVTNAQHKSSKQQSLSFAIVK